MSLVDRIVSSSVLQSIDQVIKIIAVLVVSPIVIDALGKSQYGIWILLVTAFSYFNLLDFGVGFSATRFLSRAIGKSDDDQIKEVIGTCATHYRYLGVLSVVLVLVVVAFFPALFNKEGSDIQISPAVIAIYGFSITLRFFFRIHLIILKSQIRYDLIVIASVVKVIIQGISVIVTLQYWQSLSAVVLIYAITDLLEQCLLVFLTRKTTLELRSHNSGFSGSFFWKLIRFSSITFMGNLGQTMRNRADPVIVGLLLSPAAVAVYAIGSRFVVYFRDFIGAFMGGPLTSAFSQLDGNKDSKDEFDKTLKLSVQLSVALTMLGGVGLWFLGEAFILRWVGDEFSESHLLLKILLIGFASYLMQYPCLSVFYSRDKHWQLTVLTFAGGFCNVVLSLILGRIYGLTGVAIATAIEMCLCYVIAFPILVSRITGIPYLTYLMVYLLRPTLLVAVPMVVYQMLVADFVTPKYLKIAILAVGQSFVFLVVAWLFVLSRDQRNGVIRRLSKRLQRG